MTAPIEDNMEFTDESAQTGRPFIEGQTASDPAITESRSYQQLRRRTKVAIWTSLLLGFIISLLTLLGKGRTSDSKVIVNAFLDGIVKEMTAYPEVITEFIPIQSTTSHPRSFSSFPEPIGYVEISSLEDFSKLDVKPETDGIVINSLVDTHGFKSQTSSETNNSNEDTNKNKLDAVINNSNRIKHIWIKGPISNIWLALLLQKCDNVAYLELDINQLCVASKVRWQKWGSLQAVTLPHLKYLRIVNSFQCSISSWVFQWELPNIQQLKIRNANLKNLAIDSLNRFLSSHVDSLTSVVISRSYFCSNCNIIGNLSAQIEIQIKDELQEPL